MFQPSPHDSMVVFEDRQDVRLLRWLKPGYRHCYCLLKAERGWLLIDPLLRDLRCAWLDLPERFDLIAHYAEQGRRILSGRAYASVPAAPVLRPLTCVEIVKRAVGLGDLRAWTPFQLHRSLLGRGWQRHGLS